MQAVWANILSSESFYSVSFSESVGSLCSLLSFFFIWFSFRYVNLLICEKTRIALATSSLTCSSRLLISSICYIMSSLRDFVIPFVENFGDLVAGVIGFPGKFAILMVFLVIFLHFLLRLEKP